MWLDRFSTKASMCLTAAECDSTTATLSVVVPGQSVGLSRCKSYLQAHPHDPSGICDWLFRISGERQGFKASRSWKFGLAERGEIRFT